VGAWAKFGNEVLEFLRMAGREHDLMPLLHPKSPEGAAHAAGTDEPDLEGLRCGVGLQGKDRSRRADENAAT
jgi:hypothetical protein